MVERKEALGAARCAMQNSRTGMDDVHRAHGTTGVVENPLLLDAQVLGSNLLLQLGDNEVDDGAGVLAMALNGALRQIVQVLRVENVELLQARVEVAVDGGEQGQEDGQEAQIPEGEAAAAAAGAGRLLAGGFRRHWEGCWGEVWEMRKVKTRKLNREDICPWRTPEFHCGACTVHNKERGQIDAQWK